MEKGGPKGLPFLLGSARSGERSGCLPGMELVRNTSYTYGILTFILPFPPHIQMAVLLCPTFSVKTSFIAGYEMFLSNYKKEIKKIFTQ
jgi:hypothetical protein